MEAPFLHSWDFTVFFTTASTSHLNGHWSPIQVLTMAQVAELQWSYGNWCFQLGIAVGRSKIKMLVTVFCETVDSVQYCGAG